MDLHSHQSDLRWSLAAFERPKQAAEFFARLNGAVSVYSTAVRKIYTDYETEVIGGKEPLLVIQPDMYEFTSMFHNVEKDAIRRSSVIIYEDKDVLKLSAVLAKTEYRQSFTLKEGCYRLFDGEFIDGPFLPILTYGDLRTLPNQSRPVMQLHGLQTTGLTNLSTFQVNDLLTALSQNLIDRLGQNWTKFNS